MKGTPYKNLIKGDTKYCPKCDSYRNLECFYKAKNRKDGYQLWCRKCNLANLNKSYKTWDVNYRRQKSRQYLLKVKYGLTPEQYDEIFKQQNGVCAICCKPETSHSNKKGPVDSLRVDHDHKTGKVRGLLCSECNFGISKFDDKMGIMMSAVCYILKSMHEEERGI